MRLQTGAEARRRKRRLASHAQPPLQRVPRRRGRERRRFGPPGWARFSQARKGSALQRVYAKGTALTLPARISFKIARFSNAARPRLAATLRSPSAPWRCPALTAALRSLHTGTRAAMAQYAPAAAQQRGGASSAALAAWPTLRSDDFDTFLFDQDGVLWHGAQPIRGSLEAVARLQAAGKRAYFVTNNSTRTRVQVAERLSKAGVHASPADVLTSAAAAADYLLSALTPTQRSLFVVGESGLVQELQGAGFSCATAPDGEVSLSEHAFASLFESASPLYDAVVVGYDTAFTSAKLARASAAIQRGALLVGTNPDAGDACGKGIMPGTGPLISALESATGVQAVVVGKPSPTLILQLIAKHGLDPARTVMVGDRLDTDMAFGAAGGVARCLVLSGVATEEQAAQLPLTDPRRPTHVMSCLADLQW